MKSFLLLTITTSFFLIHSLSQLRYLLTRFGLQIWLLSRGISYWTVCIWIRSSLMNVLVYNEMVETKQRLTIGTANEWKNLATWVLTNRRTVLWKTRFYGRVKFRFTSRNVSINVPGFLPWVPEKLSEHWITKLVVNNFEYGQDVVPLSDLKVYDLAMKWPAFFLGDLREQQLHWQNREIVIGDTPESRERRMSCQKNYETGMKIINTA